MLANNRPSEVVSNASLRQAGLAEVSEAMWVKTTPKRNAKSSYPSGAHLCSVSHSLQIPDASQLPQPSTTLSAQHLSARQSCKML